MPVYQFKCSQCGEQFEIFATISEKEKGIKCPHCDSLNLDQIYNVNILLKGSGSSPGCTSSCKVCHPQECKK